MTSVFRGARLPPLRELWNSKWIARLSSSTMVFQSHPTAAGHISVDSPALSTDEILVDETWGMKIAILNRPRKLNALTISMVSRMLELYEKWEKDRHVHMVLLKANGRGFCAGGDVAAVYHLQKAGKLSTGIEFFRQEYKLNYLIGTYKKPHIAFLNGVVMGGGTGISIHGRFCVATENSVFAMPETAIALHPDVGASHYLSRLPGHLGEYLALTGTRLDGAEMVACKLATHFVPSHRLGMLEERLSSLNTGDPIVIRGAIDEFCDIVHLDEKSPLHRSADIDNCFKRSTVEEIIHALEKSIPTTGAADAWVQETIAALRKHSPHSLKVTLRSIREGRKQKLVECLQREFRLSVHLIEGKLCNDFSEGCRAVLVDKDNSPKWDPPVLEQVSPELVDYAFSPIEGELGEELDLPAAEREPQNTGRSRL